jgi:hypothetical protein
MVERLKESWEELSESKPGHRFQERYRRRQQDEQGHILKRVILIVLGTVIALGSLFLAPLPGPGFATVFLGLAILAGELLTLACLFDRGEVGLRRVGRWIKSLWVGSPKAARNLIVLAIPSCMAALAYLTF